MEGQNQSNDELKLFMLLLGSKAPGRHVEQHDFFFGVATCLKDLVPEINAFWPEALGKIHIDGWREVNVVEDYRIKIILKIKDHSTSTAPKLFFINLGGYQENKFEEQHYVILTVQNDRTSAIRSAKETLFFKHNHFKGASSHIDDKYGIDVDDLYEIEEILSPHQKETYQIDLTFAPGLQEDALHLGYFKLSNL